MLAVELKSQWLNAKTESLQSSHKSLGFRIGS
jgi:hypothetical protein